MRFAQPALLHLLWGVVLLGIFFYWRTAYHKGLLRRFAQEQLLKDIAAGFSPGRFVGKKVLMLAVFFWAVLALARPQWGFQWQEIKRQGLDIIIAIDASKSMLTQDVKPNRLQRTKLAVQDLLKKLKGDRVGLIAFAGDAFMMCPLTADYAGFLLSLNDLDVHSIPRGGTNLSRALEEALKSYKDVPNQYKAVIIITDGENLEGDPLSWAKKAKESGIKVYCVGIGTKEGELIQIVNESGGTEFLKDAQGNFVKSRLNETFLQQIALTSGGTYVRSSGAESGLDVIYDQELVQWQRREIESRMEKRFFERFQIPLTLALLCLLGETCLTTRKKIIR